LDIRRADRGRSLTAYALKPVFIHWVPINATLFKRRPDITWVNKPTKIEVNPVWKVAYETGDWKEAWTEPDGRAEIQGKYFVMWLLNPNEGVWYINAAFFTPQRCIGESKYCRPRESNIRK
jgi:hypothetical protein